MSSFMANFLKKTSKGRSNSQIQRDEEEKNKSLDEKLEEDDS